MKKLFFSALLSIGFVTVYAQTTWLQPSTADATSNAWRSGNIGVGFFSNTSSATQPQTRLHFASSMFYGGPEIRFSRLNGTAAGAASFFDCSIASSYQNVNGLGQPKLSFSLYFNMYPSGTASYSTVTPFEITQNGIFANNGLTAKSYISMLNASGQSVFGVNNTGQVSAMGLNAATSTSDRFSIGAGIGTTVGPYIELWKPQGTTDAFGDVALVTRKNSTAGSGDFRVMTTDGAGSYFSMINVTPTTVTNGGNTTTYGVTEITGELVVKNTSGNQFKVSNDGNIRCREVRVNTDVIPDYVFEPNYDLLPLSKLEKYIEENKHLPGVPSAKEYEEQGYIEVTKLNLKLLEKVEELTLYMLEKEKQMIELQNQVKELQNQISKFQK